VLISPIQVNRAGKVAADKKENPEERRYGRDAIREFSELCHDMDFIFSVWSDDSMKLVDYTIELDVVKNPRKGRAPIREIVHLEKRTGKVIGYQAAREREKKEDEERQRRGLAAIAVMDGEPEPPVEESIILPEDVR
jgi:hypothetical protein